jgi:hypothetical protein
MSESIFQGGPVDEKGSQIADSMIFGQSNAVEKVLENFKSGNGYWNHSTMKGAKVNGTKGRE